MLGKQQRGCSKEENEEKKVELVDGRGWTSSNKAGQRNQKSQSALGQRCSRVPGEWVGLWGCSPDLFYRDVLHPIHRTPQAKHQTQILLQQTRPHITQLHYNSGVNFPCYLISSALWAGERGRVV